jgi:hypothetical protein
LGAAESSSGGKEVWRRCEGTRAEEGLRRFEGGRDAVWIEGRLRGRAMGTVDVGEAILRKATRVCLGCGSRESRFHEWKRGCRRRSLP